MSQQFNLSDEDIALFKNAIGATKKIKQDKVVHKVNKQLKNHNLEKKQQQDTLNNEFYFSDDFQPLLAEDPIRYLREDGDPNELKKFRLVCGNAFFVLVSCMVMEKIS